MKHTAVSLFAGVGGFDLAMQRHGIDVVAACEIDKHAQAVLKRQFPKTQIFNDVKELTGNDVLKAGFIPDGGIITGGFPCQDLSVAGKRLGFTGQRSSLFYQIARLADETKAEWLVLENVPGLLTSQRGADMGAVVGTLVELGYGVSWRVLDAQNFGVPQRRRRVFIVARRAGDTEASAKVLFERPSVRGNNHQSREERQKTAGDSGQSTASPISLYEPHHGDGRETVNRSNTLAARMGTGGNNLPVLVEPVPIQGSMIGRNDQAGPGGRGFGDEGDPMFTLNTTDRHATTEPAVFGNTGFAKYTEGEVTTLQASSYKRPEENVVVDETFVKVIRSGARDENGNLPPEVWATQKVSPTLNIFDNTGDSRAVVAIVDEPGNQEPALLTMREGSPGGGKGPLVTVDRSLTLATGNNQTLFTNQTVRRLTPIECERLQGFPDNWTEFGLKENEPQADSHRYKQMGNAVAVPVVEWVIEGIIQND